jgi:antitoxin component YwqK of YwqJK toxin-antitoxin module
MIQLKYLFIIIIMVSILGCKSKINQLVNQQREGRWVTYDTLDYVYKTRGRYHNNEEIGTWKYYRKDILIRKDKYCKNICKTKFFHPNGRLQKKGCTKSETKKDSLHWFYFGKWKYYDLNRKLIKSAMYINGKTSDSLKLMY